MSSEIASVIRELTEPVSNGENSSMEEKPNSNFVRFSFVLGFPLRVAQFHLSSLFSLPYFCHIIHFS